MCSKASQERSYCIAIANDNAINISDFSRLCGDAKATC
jgi:hypothetical protein